MNAEYSQENVTTNLVYSFAKGDRCTLHYWIDADGNKNYFNQPCVDVAVLGYDAGSYLVKVENSSAFTFSSGNVKYNGQQINGFNIFMRLSSPAPQSATASTAVNETAWREIGEQQPIVDGLFTKTTIVINDGGCYYKTRQFPDAILPYSNPPVQVLATDLNYSDFYFSQYYSFGRVRTYYDVLEKSEQPALIITGQPYVTGSRINGLNRFYPAHIYGNNNGQTSSSKGSIQIMDQVGQELIIYQNQGIFKIPVNEAYTVLNAELTGQSISSILLNNGRYDEEGVGTGGLKAYCRRYSRMYFVDANTCLPYTFANKAVPIPGKMSKYFKTIIQYAVQNGLGIALFYNDYYEEAVMTIKAESGVLLLFPFKDGVWQASNLYVIVPGDVSATPNGAHCTASYNGATGKVTYTPDANYVGNDVATFTFDPGTGTITLNNCLQWTAGSGTVNPFSFTPVINALLSTDYISNSILVNGNDFPVAISITGGTYSINSGSFTSLAGTVNAGDTVRVKQTSSGSNSTTTTATLTIDSQSANYDVTTQASTPAFNVNIYNNSSSVTIASSSVGTHAFGPVSPGGSQSIAVPNGTYTISVKTGAGGTRYINVTGQPEQSGGAGYLAVFPGVVITTGSITVIDIQDTP